MSATTNSDTSPFVVVALTNLFGGLLGTVTGLLTNTAVFAWDLLLALFNAVTPGHAPTRVVPQGYAGANGLWPKYVAPKAGDSRCSCPALNAMANHGTTRFHFVIF